MSWAILLPIIVEVVKEALGPLAAKLIERLLNRKIQDGAKVPLTAVPAEAMTTKDALKEFVKRTMTGLIASLPAVFPPSLKSVLTQVVDRMDGFLFDLVWARLFPAEPVKVPLTASPPLDVPPEAEAAFLSEFGESAT